MPRRLFNVFFAIFAAIIISALIHFLAQHMIQTMNIGSGTIYRKGYTAAAGYPVSQITNGTITTSSSTKQPEKFTIYIRDTEGKTNWVYVPEELWKEEALGDFFDGDCFCIQPK